MRKGLFLTLGLALLAASLVILPAAAKAEMYVEGYLGGVAGSGSDSTAGFASSQRVGGVTPFFIAGGAEVKSGIDPALLGGLKIGTWFVKEGFLGYDYPDWMKYFGFYIDFSVQRVNLNQSSANWAAVLHGAFEEFDKGTGTFSSEGFMPTLAFMFAGRYGFMKDDEVPFGRLQPYLAAGPAIMWLSQTPTLTFNSVTSSVGPTAIGALPFNLGGINAKLNTQTSTMLGFAIDAGLRYYMLKNVSLDVSFKYRFAPTNFNFKGKVNDINIAEFFGNQYNVNYSPTLNLFSGQVGVAYHF